MSLANILKTNKSHFTDSISEYDLTSVKCDSIGSRVGLAPLILEGVGLDGNGSAIVGGMSAVESAGLFSNDAQKVADLSGGVMDFTNPPQINGVPIVAEIPSNLDVSGIIVEDLEVTQDASFNGDVLISGTLEVEQQTSLKDTSFNGAVDIEGGDLNLKANLQGGGNINIDKDANVKGNTVIDGNVVFTSQSSGLQSNIVRVGQGALTAPNGSIAIGGFAQSQNDGTISIGNSSVSNSTAGISIGLSSGVGTQSNTFNSICIGRQTDATETGGIAIGGTAKSTSSRAIAIGDNANSDGNSAVCIGKNAGLNSLGNNSSVNVGSSAGSGSNASFTTNIGGGAGVDNSGEGGVNIGLNAGFNGGNGTASIAIGRGAGQDGQDANTIILNATGNPLQSTGTDRFIVQPVRKAVGGTILQYDGASGEISYSNQLDYSNDDLDISGSTLISNTSGGNSGDFLRIKINNTFYKIQLDNDV